MYAASLGPYEPYPVKSPLSMRFFRQEYGVGFHALLHTKKLQT